MIEHAELSDVRLENTGSELLKWAQSVEIQTFGDYEAVGNRARDIKTFKANVEAFIAPMRDPAYESWKAIKDRENKLLKTAETVEKIINPKMIAWKQREEARRREEQRAAEEAARKVAEEKRLAEAIEMERQAKARAEEARLAAEAGKAQQALRLQAESAARQAASVAALERPIEVAPVVMPVAQKVDGVSSRKTYRAEVVDKLALIKAIVEGTASLEFVDANMSRLNSIARAMRETMNIPGVVAVAEESLAVRKY